MAYVDAGFVILFVALLNAGLEMMFVNKNGIKE